MGFQAISKYLAVFFALLAWQEVLLTHGRQLKPMNNQHSSVNTDQTLGPEDNVQPALPPRPSIHVPSSAENKAASPESPKYHVVVAGSGDYVNAFRPTTPGSSPGVGHKKFAGQETKMVFHSPDVDSVTERFKNDFRPTEPGHSGDVGHACENINGGPN